MLVTVLLTLLPAGHAVLFKSTADPSYNSTAPSGTLTTSGWQYEGFWGNFLGTPIAPTFFLAAKHVGGTNGQVFALNGFTYHALTNFPDANSDLQIWKVAETFPDYALLYTNTDEMGNHCVVFGRGTQRGPAVILGTPPVTNGWQWGTGDGAKRWGENDVASIIPGGAGQGDFLYETFDRATNNANECHLSVGDSSGALFIQDGIVWKLAGINYAVDGPFSNAVDGTMFEAALMDRGGLFQQNGTNWTFIPNTGTDNPSGFYSTRVSSHIAWINSVINFQPGIDLRITAIQRASTNILISFATGSNKVYRVDWRNDLATGAWATLTSGIVGNGGIMTVTNFGAAVQPKRFYRLLLVP